MKLYVSLGDNCRDVLRRIDSSADVDLVIVKPRRSLLENAEIRFPVKNEIIEELPGVPTLIDGENVIVGSDIIPYLAANPRTAKFLV